MVARRGWWGNRMARPGLARLANEKERALCHAHQQSITALMPTERNANHRKLQYVAVMPTRAIRLTITWQCYMVVGHSAFWPFDILTRSWSNKAERPIFIYTPCPVKRGATLFLPVTL